MRNLKTIEDKVRAVLQKDEEAKTIIAIVLVVFIVGAAVWLNIRNRKNK